ncbi:MAG: S49 family peptidase [Pseudomonadota bacterium]
MGKLLKLIKGVWDGLPFTPKPKRVVSVIELSGVIGADSAVGRRSLNRARCERAIEAAFKPSGLQAVCVIVNSPGGSPVQSRLILGAIRDAARKHETPVFTFIEDVGASGGYILALAGDEIYADESSIVGSIGVISSGFGAHEALAKLGVERRVYTAGENKSQLDPFKPEDPKDVAKLETTLNALHDQFIALVKDRRGDKLADDPEIFSGAFWPGPKAQELGLIDGVARFAEFLRDRYGEDVIIKKAPLDRPGPLGRILASSLVALASSEPSSPHAVNGAEGALLDPAALLSELEVRALWAKFGR